MRVLILIAVLACFGVSAAGTEQPLKVQRLYSEAPLTPGANGLLKIQFKLKPGHKAYVDQFQLRSSNLKDFKNTKLKVYPSAPFLDPHTKKIREVVSKDFSLETVIELPQGLKRLPASVDLELTYQACTLKFCYTPKTLKLSLPES